MVHLTSHHLEIILATYGYWAVLLFVAVESMGIPVPGETMLLVASVYAGTTHRLEIAAVIAAAAAGAIAGDNIGFVVGRTGGYRLLWRLQPRPTRGLDADCALGAHPCSQPGGDCRRNGWLIKKTRGRLLRADLGPETMRRYARTAPCGSPNCRRNCHD